MEKTRLEITITVEVEGHSVPKRTKEHDSQAVYLISQRLSEMSGKTIPVELRCPMLQVKERVIRTTMEYTRPIDRYSRVREELA